MQRATNMMFKPSTIVIERSDGTFDVDVDGESTPRHWVQEDQLRKRTPLIDAEAALEAGIDATLFEIIGATVDACLYENAPRDDSLWYRATWEGIHADGSVTLKYWRNFTHGERPLRTERLDVNVPQSCIKSPPAMVKPEHAHKLFVPHLTKCDVRLPSGVWQCGLDVLCERLDGFDLQDADGQRMGSVQPGDMRLAGVVDNDPNPLVTPKYPLRSQIEGRWHEGSDWLAGQVREIYTDGSLLIEYDTTSEMERLSEECVRLPLGEQSLCACWLS